MIFLPRNLNVVLWAKRLTTYSVFICTAQLEEGANQTPEITR